jgi:hypothetical protein
MKIIIMTKTAKILTEKPFCMKCFHCDLGPSLIHLIFLILVFLTIFSLAKTWWRVHSNAEKVVTTTKRKEASFYWSFWLSEIFFLVEEFSNGAPFFGDRYFQSIVSCNLKLVPINSSSKSANQKSLH